NYREHNACRYGFPSAQRNRSRGVSPSARRAQMPISVAKNNENHHQAGSTRLERHMKAQYISSLEPNLPFYRTTNFARRNNGICTVLRDGKTMRGALDQRMAREDGRCDQQTLIFSRCEPAHTSFSIARFILNREGRPLA